MTARFVCNFSVFVVGVLLVIAVFAFAPGPVSWIGTGGGVAAVIVALWNFALRGQGAAQRWVDVALAAAGAWTIVGTRCYPLSTARWMTFAAGCAFLGLSGAGLILREVSLARVMHRVQSRQAPGRLTAVTVVPHDGVAQQR